MTNEKLDSISRRSFIKSTALGTLVVGAGPTILVPGRAEAQALEKGFVHHPTMNPLRVVTIKDPGMTKSVNPIAPWKVQDGLVNADAVGNNIDKLACGLAEDKDPKVAWKKLLLKPPGKGWSDTVVAIKTNNIGRQHTKSAVLARICHVLTGQMGVKASNVIVYDACHGGNMSQKTPFKGLPKGIVVANKWGGITTPVRVGKPWASGNETVNCVESLAKGKVDILINIAVCKGHSGKFGELTMCMKNHMGTFDPKPGHGDNGTGYLLAINRSPLILGETDKTKNRVAFPRQQLCIVDALWASERGPQVASSVQPNRLFMGTFGPAVDYMVGLNFRKVEMGWRVNKAVLDRFLTDFGFRSANLPNKGRLIAV